MNSLRDTMEKTFAAAAFAERNLGQDARECLEGGAQPRQKTAEARTKDKAKRPRPSLKA